jgi:hypothetical protein
VRSRNGLGGHAGKLAGWLAGPANDRKVLELARAVAEADIRLKEIGQLKLMMIESARPDGIDSTARGHAEDVCQVSEAIRNSLPDLVKLLRYETREAGRKDRAMRKLIRTLATQAGQS